MNAKVFIKLVFPAVKYLNSVIDLFIFSRCFRTALHRNTHFGNIVNVYIYSKYACSRKILTITCRCKCFQCIRCTNSNFYATLAYIRHFISAGCYDNNPWYLGTNLRGIQILRGFIFLNAPLILNAPLNLLLGTSYRPAFSTCDGGSPTLNILYLPGLEHAPPLIES